MIGLSHGFPVILLAVTAAVSSCTRTSAYPSIHSPGTDDRPGLRLLEQR